MTTSLWYVHRDGEEYGPYTAAQLKEHATHGHIAPSDFIWADGFEEWLPASSIKGLIVPEESSPPPAVDSQTSTTPEVPSRAPRRSVGPTNKDNPAMTRNRSENAGRAGTLSVRERCALSAVGVLFLALATGLLWCPPHTESKTVKGQQLVETTIQDAPPMGLIVLLTGAGVGFVLLAANGIRISRVAAGTFSAE